jgi:TatD DNase family protein
VIDFHCHLDLYPDPHAVAARCAELGMYVLSVTTVPSAFAGTRALEKSGRIKTALGLHPELAARRVHELALFEQMLPQTRYVGEVGLDGSREHKSSIDTQRAVFAEILRLCAMAGNKILTIHSRGAVTAVLDELARVPAAGNPVLHWFSGSKKQVHRAAEMGCWFSVGPSMLGSDKGRAAVAAMPPTRVLSESDGPFGLIERQPAFPWDAWGAIPHLAMTWGMPEHEAEERLQSNFRALVS